MLSWAQTVCPSNVILDPTLQTWKVMLILNAFGISWVVIVIIIVEFYHIYSLHVLICTLWIVTLHLIHVRAASNYIWF